MRILVLGAYGLIGGYVCARLLAEDHVVVGVGRADHTAGDEERGCRDSHALDVYMSYTNAHREVNTLFPCRACPASDHCDALIGVCDPTRRAYHGRDGSAQAAA